MSERLSFSDFARAGCLCTAVALALLAIKYSIFGWMGAAAALLLMVALFCAGQRRVRWRLIVPALALGAVGYSAASATVSTSLL
ncbi:hypothetical protein [Maricaulis sp.]|uniref:hypothetical protein n=1 Tax=Maricaulis sp. TaxID=1486257 RepID=UPI003A94824C